MRVSGPFLRATYVLLASPVALFEVRKTLLELYNERFPGTIYDSALALVAVASVAFTIRDLKENLHALRRPNVLRAAAIILHAITIVTAGWLCRGCYPITIPGLLIIAWWVPQVIFMMSGVYKTPKVEVAVANDTYKLPLFAWATRNKEKAWREAATRRWAEEALRSPQEVSQGGGGAARAS